MRLFNSAGGKYRVSASLLPCLLSLFGVGAVAAPPTAADKLRVLIVGGGPLKSYNQAAIENNVRYVAHLAAAQAAPTVLFADGSTTNKTVLAQALVKASVSEKLAHIVLDAGYPDDDAAGPEAYHAPNLGVPLQGPALFPNIGKAMNDLIAPSDTRPIMLYFTGHGSHNDQDEGNNTYCLWNNGNYSVRQLAGHLSNLTSTVPVRLVMVQCYSGAFANLIFEGGDPKAPAMARDFAGFFAATPDREAAGCTSAVNEAEYRDFTSYFFAALCGRDRVGRPVSGVDYNGDGRVGMDEAYCYAIAHDESIDVPVATSDAYVRRFATLTTAQVLQTTYAQMTAWATPAQRAALNELSRRIGLKGEARIKHAMALVNAAYAGANEQGDDEDSDAPDAPFDNFMKARQKVLHHMYLRWPVLRRRSAAGYAAARAAAITALVSDEKAGRLKDLDAAESAYLAEADAGEDDLQAVYALRFVRLGKTVALSHWIRAHGAPAVRERFERLIAAEGETWLAPAP